MRLHTPELYVRLPEYKLYDSPYPKDIQGERHDTAGPGRGDPKYMSRPRIEEELRTRLESANRSGSVLVTGYRGVGKSSMVRKVLEDMHRASEHAPAEGRAAAPKILHAELNLAQDELDESAILRLMAIELLRLFDEMRKAPYNTYNRWFRWMNWIASIGMTVVLFFAARLLIISRYWQHFWSPMDHSPYRVGHVPEGVDIVVQFVVPALLGIGLYRVMLWWEWRYRAGIMELSMSRLKSRLRLLITHIRTEMSTEQVSGMTAIPSIWPFSFARKQNITFPIARTKEIELELIDILQKFTQLDQQCIATTAEERRNDPCLGTHRHVIRRRIVFVIDELDKLVPRGFRGLWEKELEDPTEVPDRNNAQTGLPNKNNDHYRERQKAIAGLFANLKHFLNVAEAKFIFIGGRELYDGVLADTSDRDAFFGSIFNQVVYVPSFLKEEQTRVGVRVEGVTTTVERYVSEALLPRMLTQTELADLGSVYRQLLQNDVHTAEEIRYVYTALQNFSVYLTFRSNGIAKKLVQLFERHIARLSFADLQVVEARPDTMVISTEGGSAPGLYLRLPANDQYAHGLLAYFYRPFISAHSRYYRSLNDKHLVALTYMLDHLFKFHSSAFSFFHLQMAPETIAVDKVPEFHKFLDDIVQRLTIQSLREIRNGLFDFQFYTRIYNEIAYLSKISELDSAAMNFTLDESLPIKQHFYRRLAHTHSLERQQSDRDTDGVTTSGLASVHHTLGDLHFYDSQLDEALGQYRAAARLVEPRRAVTANAPPLRPCPERFNSYLKLSLKQVLCLEKMRTIENALALATRLSKDVLHHVSEWEGTRADDIGNWRLMTLAIVHRVALAEKTSRRGLHRDDLNDLATYLGILSRNGRSQTQNIPLSAVVHAALGTILHYSGQSVEGIKHSFPTFHCDNAASAHKAALNIALDEPAHRALSDLDLFNAVNKSCAELSNPKLQLIGSYLSKTCDTLIAAQHDASCQGLWRHHHELFGTVLTTLLVHPVFGRVAGYTVLAAHVYRLAGNLTEALFQIKKLLFYLIERTNRSIRHPFPYDDIVALTDMAIQEIHMQQLHIDRQQTSKFSVSSGAQPTDANSQTLSSYYSDLLELQILRDELFLKVGAVAPATIQQRYGNNSSRVTLQFTRARMLMLCIRSNWMSLDRALRRGIFRNSIDASNRLNLSNTVPAFLDRLVTDSIHCSIELLSTIRLFGAGYMASHSLLGKANEHLADWCLILRDIPNPRRQDILTELELLLGSKVVTRLSPLMYYTMAADHYQQSIHLHDRGPSYRRIMNDMYMLEDDYMDNFYHFCCALDRMFVGDAGNGRPGLAFERIKKLRVRISELEASQIPGS